MLGRNVGVNQRPVVVQEHRFDAAYRLELCSVAEVEQAMRLFVKVQGCGFDFLENLALFLADGRFALLAECLCAFVVVLLGEIRFVLDIAYTQKREDCCW